MVTVTEHDIHSTEANNEKNDDNFNGETPIPGPPATDTQEDHIETAVYSRRWLMLAVVVLLNVSNGALWISFATIANQTRDYFDVSPNAVNWFSLVYYVTMPMMYIALWVTDKLGFKPSALSGSVINGLGSAIRLVGTVPGIPSDARYPLVMTGQTITALAQPFILSLPTKVSEVWFPENQRTISTAIAAMSQPFGFMVASIISPSVVSESGDVPTSNYIISGLGIAVGIFGLLVRENKPPKPPSIGAAKAELNHKSQAQSYLIHLSKILRNKDFMVLTLVIGGGMGLLSTLQTMMAQMICPWGYGDGVAGLCSATLVLGGFLGAAAFSYLAEKTKRLEEIVNVGFTFSILSAIIFILIIKTKNITWALATVSGVMGFLAMGVYPVCLEAGVETMYPLDEAFSSGMIVVSGQIQGAIFIPVMEALGQPMSLAYIDGEVCSSGSYTEVNDLTYSSIFLVGFAVILNIILIIFFRPTYKRLEAEKEKVQSNATMNSQISY